MENRASLLTAEVRALVGKKLPPKKSTVVTAQDIRKYCEATGDINPLYTDESYARKGPNGGIVAPPTYYQVMLDFLTVGAFAPVQPGVDTDQEIAWFKKTLKVGRALDATQTMEFLDPIRPGDVLSAQVRIARIGQKQLRVGPAFLVTLERTCTNQNGKAVCKEIREFFYY